MKCLFWYIAAIVYMFAHNWLAIMSAQNDCWAAMSMLCTENAQWLTVIMHTGCTNITTDLHRSMMNADRVAELAHGH